MKRHYLVFIASFLISPGILWSQVSDGYDAQSNLNDVGHDGHIGVVRTFNHAYEGVKGSPLLFEEWQKGDVTLVTGKLYENVDLKLDLYQNELISKSRTKQAIYLNRSQVDHFSIIDPQTSQKHLYEKISFTNNAKGLEPDQYLEVLFDNNQVKLLRYPQKIFVKADYKGAYSAGRAFDEFRYLDNFYLQLNDQSVHKIRSTRSLLKDLNDKGLLKKFIKENDLDTGQAEDLVVIMKYYAGNEKK
ncbi:MAG: hypothetical protein ACNS62_03045 [Candidatus Cyclobacteriaceae bacterium M3_2C_046]